jgi:hypothetical protein
MAYVARERLSELTDEYTFWCKAQGLKCIDAMELIHEGELNRHQNAWVVDFIARWEEAEESDLQECWHREGGE